MGLCHKNNIKPVTSDITSAKENILPTIISPNICLHTVICILTLARTHVQSWHLAGNLMCRTGRFSSAHGLKLRIKKSNNNECISFLKKKFGWQSQSQVSIVASCEEAKITVKNRSFLCLTSMRWPWEDFQFEFTNLFSSTLED